MSILGTKLRRDLWHYRGQIAASAVMMAAGVALFVSMRSMYGYLRESQAGYYAAYRFADVFASLVRAPLATVREIERLEGVAAVEPRIVADVVVDVPGARDLVTARLVSIPDRETGGLNRLHLVEGAYPGSGGDPGVVVSRAFAGAHRLRVGDTLGALINGRRERLTVAALGQSPEFIYEIRGGGADFLPDAKRFGVIWVPHRMMAAAFDLTGAFNDLLVGLERNGDTAAVIAGIDRRLERWGGLGAYGREDQLSNRFVTDEIAETQVTSILLPTIFIGVTAFMLYLVTSRLIATEREQIALLKAFGFGSGRVVAHYALFTLATIGIGTVLGTGAGLWFAEGLAKVYARFYQFPTAVFRPDPRLVLATLGIAGAAALAGGLASVRTALRLPPAEAMRPPVPPAFRASRLERGRWFRRLRPSTRIVARNLIRRPFKSTASVLGVGFGFAIVVVSWYAFDAIDLIRSVAFEVADRSDIRVGFDRAVSRSARLDLARLPGVLAVEVSRTTPVRLRVGPRSERVALMGRTEGGALRRIVEPPDQVVALPPDGLVLTGMLARRLRVSRGDQVEVETLEGAHRTTHLTLAGTVEELIGFSAYAELGVVHRLLREGDLITGADLAIAGDRETVERALREFPRVAGVGIRSATIEAFDRTIKESFRISLTTIFFFACLIAAGVIYNGGRISLSERARELASLRILGFTRGEIVRMLLSEQAAITVAAIPTGALVGTMFCWLITVRFASETFRIPLVVSPRTWLVAAGVVIGAAVVTGLALRRRANRMDLVAVLKARE